MLIINVFYACKPGKREAFLDKIKEEGVDTGSRAEEGNSAYRYFRAVDDENGLLLYEEWRDKEAHAAHRLEPHYQRLQAFQDDYLDDITVNKFFVD